MAPPEANWTVEIVRIAATGGIALLGAWIGFGLANRGRKYDLLYKERFNSFKQFCDQTLQIKHYVEKVLKESSSLIDTISSNRTTLWDLEPIRRNGLEIERIVKLLDISQGSIVLINSSTRQSYTQILYSVSRLTTLIHTLKRLDKRQGELLQPVTPEDYKKALRGLVEASESTILLIENSINDAYKSLQLPDYAPIYGKQIQVK